MPAPLWWSTGRILAATGLCAFVFLWCKPDKWLLDRIRSTLLNKHLNYNQKCTSGIKKIKIKALKSYLHLVSANGSVTLIIFPPLSQPPAHPPSPPFSHSFGAPSTPSVFIWWRQWERFIKSPRAWIDFNSFMNCSNTRLWLGGAAATPPTPFRRSSSHQHCHGNKVAGNRIFSSQCRGWNRLMGVLQLLVKGHTRKRKSLVPCNYTIKPFHFFTFYVCDALKLGCLHVCFSRTWPMFKKKMLWNVVQNNNMCDRLLDMYSSSAVSVVSGERVPLQAEPSSLVVKGGRSLKGWAMRCSLGQL